MAHLIRHVTHGDHFRSPRVTLSPDAELLLSAAVRPVHPLGQLVKKEAAGELSVELTQSLLVLQEIPQTHTVLHQQTHKLRLVADQSREHGPVEVTGLEDNNKTEEQDTIRFTSAVLLALIELKGFRFFRIVKLN